MLHLLMISLNGPDIECDAYVYESNPHEALDKELRDLMESAVTMWLAGLTTSPQPCTGRKVDVRVDKNPGESAAGSAWNVRTWEPQQG